MENKEEEGFFQKYGCLFLLGFLILFFITVVLGGIVSLRSIMQD